MRLTSRCDGLTDFVSPFAERGAPKPSFDCQPTHRNLTVHYGVSVLPARAYRLNDKVENGVQVVSRRLPARLRHQHLFSLNELNLLLRTLQPDLNHRPFMSCPAAASAPSPRWTSRRAYAAGAVLRIGRMEGGAALRRQQP